MNTHCMLCHEPFSTVNVFTPEGAKETQISGICESCFDSLFDEDGEDSLMPVGSL